MDYSPEIVSSALPYLGNILPRRYKDLIVVINSRSLVVGRIFRLFQNN